MSSSLSSKNSFSEAEVDALTPMLLLIGFDETNAANLLRNKRKTEEMIEIIDHVGIRESGCEKALGMLLYTISTKISVNAMPHRFLLAEYVMNGKLKSLLQVEAALAYVNKIGTSSALDVKELEETSGVGVEISDAEIAIEVGKVVEKNREKVLKTRYRSEGMLLGGFKKDKRLRWANMITVREEIMKQIEALVGPKTEADSAKPPKPKKEKKGLKDEGKKKDSSETDEGAEDGPRFKSFGDTVGRELITSRNTPEILREHEKITGGKIVTRFPPEPNGYLHIGHAKAMTFDFGYAEENGGITYLRFDDTNPDAEKGDYIRSIQEDVAWLGFKPYKVTYSSDYFDELHALAVELIKKGLAYVDEQTPAEIREYRENLLPSPYRDRPIEESLKMFEDMRKGKYEEGKVTLRLKMDYKHDNPNMRDLVAYRIKYTPHPHAGDKWCIYPSYDYTHCLVDSLEHITHSLCTLEFESRRESYFWLVDACGLYKANVWEFSRLNVTRTVVSKRRLNKLVTDHYVHDWDDPRMPTLRGMRRRGFTPTAIKDFCRRVGVTRNENRIYFGLLEHCVRQELDVVVPRRLAVLRPLRCVITNMKDGEFRTYELPNHPKNESMGTRSVKLSNVVYIEDTDFRMEDSKDYYGLAPGKEVRLRYACNIRCDEVVRDAETGDIRELRVFAIFEDQRKVKGHLHWVSESEPGVAPRKVEFRLYEPLFTVDEPGDDWINELNPTSEVIVEGFAEPSLFSAKTEDSFQLERVGFFCVDPDTNADHLVMNRTLTLKESYPKMTK
eukprot:TRINITY_DN167_c0_g1_i1.p1 TRINITY_DN167_c0_g1~~TRINITY_DN167_c0_g1_i1.p1  ORF type:complete len:785 (+),score=231.16 TRINITY_DN167_c0_g1_i1:436-2790(+)